MKLAGTGASIAPDNWSVETAFKRYSGGLQKTVELIGGNAEQVDLFRANVTRFAAYKAVKCNQLIEQDERQPADKRHGREKLIATFDRWQQAEEQMAAKRTRRAKRFDEIAEKGFEMIKWLPSVSAEKRAEHRPFYNQIYPANSPIWDNQDIWGCKCSMGGTNLPETKHVYEDDEGEEQPLPELRADRGLEGNPAATGEIFTDNASYIREFKGDKTTINRLFNNSLRHEIEQQAIEYRGGKTIENSVLYSGKTVINSENVDNAINHLTGANKLFPKIVLDNMNKWERVEKGVKLKHPRKDFNTFNHYKTTVYNREWRIMFGVTNTGEEVFYACYDIKK